jgi:copper(I)-binding protein
MPMPRIAACLLVAALAAGGALPAAAQVAVADPWVRGTVAGQTATGLFMELRSPTATTLVAVASPLAAVVEVHEMKMEGGVMRMGALPRLPLPAGKPVQLQPGGYHVMLMGLKQPLKQGDVVPVTLTFQDARGDRQTVEVRAPVRALGAAAAPKP